MGCSTLMPQEKFFCTISTKDIPDVPENTISYKTDYLDYHVVEAGTISSPLFDYDIKYDTLSHYRVSVMGYVVFGRDANNTNQHERIDSVGITHLVIDKIGTKFWNSSCMKYQRYVFNYNITEPIKAITAGYGYRLY